MDSSVVDRSDALHDLRCATGRFRPSVVLWVTAVGSGSCRPLVRLLETRLAVQGRTYHLKHPDNSMSLERRHRATCAAFFSLIASRSRTYGT